MKKAAVTFVYWVLASYAALVCWLLGMLMIGGPTAVPGWRTSAWIFIPVFLVGAGWPFYLVAGMGLGTLAHLLGRRLGGLVPAVGAAGVLIAVGFNFSCGSGVGKRTGPSGWRS